jgi:hypothetical protein
MSNPASSCIADEVQQFSWFHIIPLLTNITATAAATADDGQPLLVYSLPFIQTADGNVRSVSAQGSTIRHCVNQALTNIDLPHCYWPMLYSAPVWHSVCGAFFYQCRGMDCGMQPLHLTCMPRPNSMHVWIWNEPGVNTAGVVGSPHLSPGVHFARLAQQSVASAAAACEGVASGGRPSSECTAHAADAGVHPLGSLAAVSRRHVRAGGPIISTGLPHASPCQKGTQGRPASADDVGEG